MELETKSEKRGHCYPRIFWAERRRKLVQARGYDSYKTHLSVKTKMESQFQRSEWNVVMLTTERHFRVMQGFCILVVLTCYRVALTVDKTSPEITPIQWVLIGMGVWAIASGFILERQVLRDPDRARRRSTRSTPLSRWRARNLVRVMSATALACWGLVLRENGGRASIAYIFFLVAGLMLLVWKPSARPPEANEQPVV